MVPIRCLINPQGDAFSHNRRHMEAAISAWRALEARTRAASERSLELFRKRGQLLPRERVALLVDAAAPLLELSTMAGYCQDLEDPERTIPGGGVITAIASIKGVRAMVVATDSGIEAGALQAMGIEKFQRAQQLALENRLPFVHLVESAGANLLKYRVEHFIHGGSNFCNLARLSAAGLPVITIVHGSSTAGGAYMPGLSDYVIMVRDRARAFLAGPPLLKAATGEIATEEELGGALMHARITGLADYLAADDAQAIGRARELLASLNWDHSVAARSGGPAPEPLYPPEDLLGLMPADPKKPIDMREVIARLIDASEFLEFKADSGSATVCGHARLNGHAVGIITNNGPIDPAGAVKATHFIQACCQTRQPLIYLQNTTGYLVGRQAEEAGMIKHGAKMIQAVANANVPQITIQCGASFGAGNYGMCGRGFHPRFIFSWPTARTAVMGAEQAAATMAQVMEAGMVRKKQAVDSASIERMRAAIEKTFDSQTSATYTSGLLLDDGIIDPRDTRRVLGLTLQLCAEAAQRQLAPVQFGVARP